MAYTSISDTKGITGSVSNLLQTGDIQSPKLQSGSAIRLGSAQPVFYITGKRADRSQLELRKLQTSSEFASADRDALQDFQGRKLIITDKDGKVWNNVFCHESTAVIKKGGGGMYLVECRMIVEATPPDVQAPTREV